MKPMSRNLPSVRRMRIATSIAEWSTIPSSKLNIRLRTPPRKRPEYTSTPSPSRRPEQIHLPGFLLAIQQEDGSHCRGADKYRWWQGCRRRCRNNLLYQHRERGIFESEFYRRGTRVLLESTFAAGKFRGHLECQGGGLQEPWRQVRRGGGPAKGNRDCAGGKGKAQGEIQW